MDADLVKSALVRIARLMYSPAQGLKKNGDKSAVAVSKITRLHDNWIAYFKIWRRRSLHRFCGRAQTY